jgi:hypothetical protein
MDHSTQINQSRIRDPCCYQRQVFQPSQFRQVLKALITNRRTRQIELPQSDKSSQLAQFLFAKTRSHKIEALKVLRIEQSERSQVYKGLMTG